MFCSVIPVSNNKLRELLGFIGIMTLVIGYQQNQQKIEDLESELESNNNEDKSLEELIELKLEQDNEEWEKENADWINNE